MSPTYPQGGREGELQAVLIPKPPHCMPSFSLLCLPAPTPIFWEGSSILFCTHTCKTCSTSKQTATTACKPPHASQAELLVRTSLVQVCPHTHTYFPYFPSLGFLLALIHSSLFPSLNTHLLFPSLYTSLPFPFLPPATIPPPSSPYHRCQALAALR